ncbi:MAG TPA: hypothetical protein VMU68_04135 [Acidimicrobiales bacterium]|nr:hypothetical protein [Acidimicrobiales bacterium]
MSRKYHSYLVIGRHNASTIRCAVASVYEVATSNESREATTVVGHFPAPRTWAAFA